MRTPWGNSDYEKHYLEGVILVGTPSHGGFMIANATAQKLLSAPARAEGLPCGDYLAFEEDCAAAIVLYELPFTREGFSGTSEDSLLRSLSMWNANYLLARHIMPDAEAYAHYTERQLEQKLRSERHPDLIVSAFGSWKDWVPAGKVGLITADGKRWLADAAGYDAREGLNLLSKLSSVTEAAVTV